MSNCCKDCHFLAKTHLEEVFQEIERFSYSWSSEERANLKVPANEDWRAEYWKGIWSERVDKKAKLRDNLLMNRKEDCFFIKVRNGMTFEGADELFRLWNDNRQLRKSYRYTQWGLGIAAGSLLLTFLIELLKFILSK